MKHAHKFERLSDVAIFCACGEIKESWVKPLGWYPSLPAICTRPHYPTYIPDWTYRPFQPPYVVTSVSGNISTDSSYVLNGSNESTYTVQS